MIAFVSSELTLLVYLLKMSPEVKTWVPKLIWDAV